MTTYPLEFHRRSEQKWILRAQASSARESTPRAALIGSRQRGQRRSSQSERRDILARRAMAAGNWAMAPGRREGCGDVLGALPQPPEPSHHPTLYQMREPFLVGSRS
jgi:hypothetical protein